MTDTFWAHIDALGGVATESGVDGLVAALAENGEAGVAAFDQILRDMKALLDTPEFARAANALADDGTGMPFSDDALEDLQYGVIAAGRERFESVVADPARVAGAWALDYAEDLGTVAAQAVDLLPEPEVDDIVAVPGGSLSRGRRWVEVAAGIHVYDNDALSYALVAAHMWDRLEGLADIDDAVVAEARRSGRIPCVDIDLQYFGDPGMAKEHSMPLGRAAKVRRYRDRWAVRAWRDASNLDPTNVEQIDAEVQDLADAVLDALRGGLSRK